MCVCVFVHLCLYMVITYNRLCKPSKVANPARGQLHRENVTFRVLLRA